MIPEHEPPKPMLMVNVPPCPECVQGKCPNCTGQTIGDDDELVPCPCPHLGHGGAGGFLVVPKELRIERGEAVDGGTR